ncbi:MAG: serine/threonine protein kinase [Xanthomonadaceae bacterium]|jgi:RIO-like serine/threonine protein kinase|nr:serine/threonine protein kinase [Xanthomonadaceae bacterium]
MNLSGSSRPLLPQTEALKADSFGRVLLVRDGQGGAFVRRDLTASPLWLRWLALYLARREARALRRLGDQPATPRLLGWDGRHLDRSFLAGDVLYRTPPRGDAAWFHQARRLLQQIHRRGIAHNDLAKEANWLVLEDGSPAVVDFQLASCGNPRSRWMRLLAREDLRHLLKHKRMYCGHALTPVERRILKRHSWLRDAWFRTGKPLYRFVTRRLLRWEDNEGQGPKP